MASDSQSVFASRVAWAVQYLKQAGVLVGVRRGVYQITDRGLSLLNSNPAEITVKTLRQFPEFAEFEGKGTESEPKTESAAPLSESKATPEESLENSYQSLRDALAHDVLEAIKTVHQRLSSRSSWIYSWRWATVVRSRTQEKSSANLAMAASTESSSRTNWAWT